MRRRLLPCLVVVALTALGWAAPAPASLIALGDSYSSGEGVPPFESGTAIPHHDTCHRSTRAWPVLVSLAVPTPVLSFACSGAEVPDVLDGDPLSAEPERRVAQLARLAGQRPDVVTLSIGGNDVGFADVLKRCLGLGDCRRSYRKGGRDVLEERIADLGARLPAVYARIRAAAPQATLVVADYPRIFAGDAARMRCAAVTGALTPAEARYLNARAASLDAAIARAATGPGIVFAEVREAFAGHELSCRGGAWVHRPRLPVAYSFHPTWRGQQALADAVAAVLQRRGITA